MVPKSRRIRHIGLEGTRHAGGQKAGAWHDVEAEMVAIVRDRGAGGRRALTAYDDGLAGLRIVEHDCTSPPGPHRCGSTTCSANAVAMPASKGVAAALQDRHANGGADPVRGGDDPKVPSISGRVVRPCLMLAIFCSASALLE